MKCTLSVFANMPVTNFWLSTADAYQSGTTMQSAHKLEARRFPLNGETVLEMYGVFVIVV